MAGRGEPPEQRTNGAMGGSVTVSVSGPSVPLCAASGLGCAAVFRPKRLHPYTCGGGGTAAHRWSGSQKSSQPPRNENR